MHGKTPVPQAGALYPKGGRTPRTAPSSPASAPPKRDRSGPVRRQYGRKRGWGGDTHWFRPREIPSLTDRRRSQSARSGGYKEGGRGRWRGKVVARHGGGVVRRPLWVPWGCPGSRGRPSRNNGALRGGRSRPRLCLKGGFRSFGERQARAQQLFPRLIERQTKWRGRGEGRAQPRRLAAGGRNPLAAPVPLVGYGRVGVWRSSRGEAVLRRPQVLGRSGRWAVAVPGFPLSPGCPRRPAEAYQVFPPQQLRQGEFPTEFVSS